MSQAVHCFPRDATDAPQAAAPLGANSAAAATTLVMA
jgi:hypothetical protein